MFLKINQITPELLFHAEWHFPISYKNTVTSIEWLIWRYLVSKYLETEKDLIWLLPEVDKSWIPIQINGNHWNISHKKDLVFIGVDSWGIGVDIEVFKERDRAFLNIFTDSEYEMLWWKNWNNFYILWTLKESVIKYYKVTLDDMNKIHLIKVLQNAMNIDDIYFNIQATLEYKGVQCYAISWRCEDLIYSVCTCN